MAKRKIITDFAALVPGRDYRAVIHESGAVVLYPLETRGRHRALSPAEARMAQHWNTQGYSQRRIAREMGCSVRAVRTALGAP